MLWFLLSVLISIGIVILLYFLPPLFGAEPVIPFWLGHLFILGLYLGLVLGVLRYRLFDLERWWFTAWIWFFGGLLVVLLDFGLLMSTQLPPVGTLSLSILVVGWIYFPARQWLWSRLLRSPSQNLESYLPILLETFFSAPHAQAFPERWQALLHRVFDPLDATRVAAPRAEVCLEQNGLVLAVPELTEDAGHVALSGRSRGNRLFTTEDVRLASFILALARKSMGLRAAQERGASLERERIARDLHDDVAPHLLTLIHRATTDEGADRARNALQVLRESIYALNVPHDSPLAQVLAEWRREAADRIEAAGVIQLDWQQPENAGGLWLSSRQRLNLTRVLREGLTNALRHATPQKMRVDVVVHDGYPDDTALP